jgi:hypothetical protein
MTKSTSGITMQCVGCKARKTISFTEAAKLTDPPFCDKCYLPKLCRACIPRHLCNQTQEGLTK